MEQINVLFLFIGAVMIFSMHAGFAFLEAGSVRKKNQVNALNKILFDWGVSAVVFMLVGYPIAYGVNLVFDLESKGLDLMNFFLHLGFAACVPAIISGGVAERAKFWTNTLAGALFVGLAYPLMEAIFWTGRVPLFSLLSIEFADYAGSVVVHSFGGWIALPAMILLGKRRKSSTIKVSSIPFLALGSWILCVGWFGFNVMSAPSFDQMLPLVAINSLLAMSGGIISGMLFSKNDAGFTHNGALAGLVAVCAGSNLFHPMGALLVGAIAGAIFVFGFEWETRKLGIDDALGVWPLHGLCGTWGGVAVGIFGLPALGGRGGVSILSQLAGSSFAIVFALAVSFIVYGSLKKLFGIRLTEQQELLGSDLTTHHVEANPEEAL